MVNLVHLRRVIRRNECFINQKQNRLRSNANVGIKRFFQHRMPEQIKTHARDHIRAPFNEQRFPFKVANELKQRFIATGDNDAALIKKYASQPGE